MWFSEGMCLILRISNFIRHNSKLNTSYCLVTDDLSNSTGKNTEKNVKNRSPIVFPYIHLPLRSTTPISPRLEFLPQTNTVCKKLTKMHLTQYPDLFVTFRGSFNINIENKNLIVIYEELLFFRRSMSPPLVFDSFKSK